MLTLIASLAILALCHAALTRGPTLFSQAVMSAVCGRLVGQRRDLDIALGDGAYARLHSGDAWRSEEREQGLLDRGLDIALRLTEIGNQYPRTMDRALAV